MIAKYAMSDDPDDKGEVLLYRLRWLESGARREHCVCRANQNAMQWERRGSYDEARKFYCEHCAMLEAQGFQLISSERGIPTHTYGSWIDPKVKVPQDGQEVQVRSGTSLYAMAVYRGGGWHTDIMELPTGLTVTGWMDPAERVTK